MAQLANRLPENVAGDFYVDSSCIDCDACRQIAPDTFQDHGGQSSVHRQPRDAAELKRALMALVACPTASIGTVSRHHAQPGVDAFPTQIVDNVYFCGFTSEASFGAWAYLIVRTDEQGGNVLVDSPRFTGPLVRRIEQMGGVRLMFLSHRDDIADHAKFAAHFHCPRFMHAGENPALLGIEQIVSGEDAVRIDEDLLSIPTPGHTQGHQVLLYRDKVLFTGDHLSWSPVRNTLAAHRDTCWYSWSMQTRSMARLLNYHFSWVLPGHGRIHGATAVEMQEHLRLCVKRMEAG